MVCRSGGCGFEYRLKKSNVDNTGTANRVCLTMVLERATFMVKVQPLEWHINSDNQFQ